MTNTNVPTPDLTYVVPMKHNSPCKEAYGRPFVYFCVCVWKIDQGSVWKRATPLLVSSSGNLVLFFRSSFCCFAVSCANSSLAFINVCHRLSPTVCRNAAKQSRAIHSIHAAAQQRFSVSVYKATVVVYASNWTRVELNTS